jgi:hypothetical protein
MRAQQPVDSRRRAALVWLIWILVAASAFTYVCHELIKGLALADSGYLETPLVLALAGQLRDGFHTLYGPFTASRPLVLIHAPLYYRLVAVVAWPFVAGGGGDAVWTSLVAGRAISFATTAATLLLAFRICVLDGASRRAGFLAMLLISSSAILGCRWATVRPDSLAMALQTLGVFWVLRAIEKNRLDYPALAPAFLAFALAFCAKQHNVVAAGVSCGLIAWECWRGRARVALLLALVATGASVALGYFLWENWLTDGLSTISVFTLPGGPFRAINYGSPKHLIWVASIIGKMSLGLLAVGVVCAWGRWRELRLSSLDTALGVYLAAELLSLVPLCIFNLGAAENYAQQAVVYAGILLARGLAPLLDDGGSMRRLVALAGAAALLLGLNLRVIGIYNAFQGRHQAMLQSVLHSPDLAACAPQDRFFAYAPHLNRLYGRCSLAHDEWLYSAYEMVGAADPRENWLKDTLVTGSVRQVVVVTPPEKGPTTLPGVDESLPELGYILARQIGPYYIWNRQRNPESPARAASLLVGARTAGPETR